MSLDFVVESRRRPAGEFKWNDVNVAQMKRLWREGASASEIAVELGCPSRSSVLGRLHREQRKEFSADLAKRAPAHAPRSNKPRGDCGGGAVASISARKAPGGNNGLQINTPRTYKTFDAPKWTDAEIPVAQRRSVLTLTDDVCHFPIGDPAKPDFFYCGGARAEPHSSFNRYCAHHSRVAYLPPNSRRGHMRDFY